MFLLCLCFVFSISSLSVTSFSGIFLAGKATVRSLSQLPPGTVPSIYWSAHLKMTAEAFAERQPESCQKSNPLRFTLRFVGAPLSISEVKTPNLPPLARQVLEAYLSPLTSYLSFRLHRLGL